MSRPLSRCQAFEPDDLMAALEASGVIGSWRHDLWADRIVLSAPLASLLGIRPEDGAHGVPLTVFLTGIHGEDRGRIENALYAAGQRVGSFALEFRTGSGQRWLGMRGRIARDASGQPAQGRGIAVDLTDERVCDGGAGAQAQCLVNRMAEHTIAMRSLVASLRRPVLAQLVDGLMLEVGRELARHLHDAENGRPH